MADAAAFCPGCGARTGTAAPAPVAAAAVAAPMPPVEYRIEGDNLQVVRVKLKPGQEVYAEAGKMVYKMASIQWETRMSGESIGDKIWGAVKRKLSGESLFMTYFRATAEGEVGFAGDYPGRIQVFDLAAGQSVLVQRDSFVCAQTTVELSIAFTKKLGAGFLGGEGFILQKLTGPGIVFIHGGGDFVEFDLKAGQIIQVNTGCIVGFDSSVHYDIQLAGGIKTAIFGGEGLFLATLTGPGRVLVQSMTLEKLRRELNPSRRGGDERGPLESITNLFGSED
jgi:uncharacterized protein (TIGR00266 family)